MGFEKECCAGFGITIAFQSQINIRPERFFLELAERCQERNYPNAMAHTEIMIATLMRATRTPTKMDNLPLC